MGEGSSSRGRVVVVAVLGLALLAAGCSGSAGGSSNGNTQGDSASPTDSAGSSSPALTPPKKKKKNVIAWVLSLGPGAPDGPPEFTAYRELQKLRCAKVFDRVAELQEPARTLYTGAAQACLAAFEGRTDLWQKSVAAYDAVAGRRGELTCMDRAAFALLGRLVTLHQQFPHRAFANAATSQAKAPPCPSISGLTPDHGAEGTPVRLTGRHLGEALPGAEVTVVDSFGNSLDAVDITHLPGALEFKMPVAPPSNASSIACIVVRAAPDWAADGATFTYESEQAGPATAFPCPPSEPG